MIIEREYLNFHVSFCLPPSLQTTTTTTPITTT